MKRILSLLLLLGLNVSLYADVRLPTLFTDHMVLQRDRPILVWGWANPKETVTVQFKAQTQVVKAGKDGAWRVTLKPEAAGGPFELLVNGPNQIRISDVLVGEVWICSGQSNMEWEVEDSDNAATEIANANFPQIRHLKVRKTVATSPQTLVPSDGWQMCSPETVAKFTAIGYFFARNLNQKLQVPIGLINTTWGGTNIETWISRQGFSESPEFREMIAGLPILQLDSLAAQRARAAKARILSLQGSPAKGSTPEWENADFNDSRWPELQAPGNWENQALGEVDGEIWLRKTVVLDSSEAIQAAVLFLAQIDDFDDTYLNGTLLGSTDRYNFKRMYPVPAGLLHPGANVITVRVTDTGGGGGIWGDPADLYLQLGNKKRSLVGAWKYQVAQLLEESSGVQPNSYPSLLFNGMVAPLIPFAFQGVIWYQGESNADRAVQYRTSFPLMIQDWRKQWNQGEFPFLFVQLSSFNQNNGNSNQGSTWAELREAQTKTLELPGTGMAVCTDIGNATDIHPRNKQDVGKRLAALALHYAYGQSIVFKGPELRSVQFNNNKAILSFAANGSALRTPDKYGYLRGFEIAGPDKKFYWAKAWIEQGNVVVFSENVPAPFAVRYGWADDAGECNLFNQEGFPTAPFRTDNWPSITEGKKYKPN
ncbi:MAG: hypothetical protein KGS48_08895 [Bacteroidetes bacterium]|nr:hypothetical protein [Bacteroidota bacterium]